MKYRINILFLLTFWLFFPEIKAELPELTYKPGIVMISGHIQNYDPKFNYNVYLYVPNIIMHGPDPHYPDIKPDGTFQYEFRLLYPTQIAFIIAENRQIIFMEPDDLSTDLIIDLTKENPEERIIYKGRYASLNTDYNHKLKTVPLIGYDKNKIEEVYGMSPDEYRDYCLDELGLVREYNNLLGANTDACLLANLTSEMNCMENIIHFRSIQEFGYMEKNQVSRRRAYLEHKEYKLPADYFDFIREISYNNPALIYCYAFALAVPRIDNFQEPATFGLYEYYENNLSLTEEEKELINHYKRYSEEVEQYDRMDEIAVLHAKYKHQADDFWLQRYNDLTDWFRRKYEKKELFITDFIDISMTRRNFMDFKPLTEEQELYFTKLTHPLAVGLLTDMSVKMKPVKKEAELVYSIGDLTGYEKGNIVETISKLHPGKVILVDMWATWCSGCRLFIKGFESVKQSLPPDEIVYVYLTNQTSPEELWKKLIVDIQGEHYRLDKEQWDPLFDHYKLIGLPFYIIIDKEGTIQETFTHTDRQTMKEKLESYL